MMAVLPLFMASSKEQRDCSMLDKKSESGMVSVYNGHLDGKTIVVHTVFLLPIRTGRDSCPEVI
jgi:hypothetical protein